VDLIDIGEMLRHGESELGALHARIGAVVMSAPASEADLQR